MAAGDETRAYGAILPGYVMRSLQLQAVNGKNIELRLGSTAIEYRYVGDPVWLSLVPLSNITGPAGAAGLRGPQGLQGLQGLTGVQGQQGIAGSQWLNGANRNTVVGRSGDWFLESDGSTYMWVGTGWVLQGSIRGLKGDTGAQGIQGVQGLQGVKGDQGIQGVKGDTGAAGANGTNGVQNVVAPLVYDSGTQTLSIDTSQLGANAVQVIGYSWLFAL